MIGRLFGRKPAPQPEAAPAAPPVVRPAPVDPQLEEAARMVVQRVAEKSKQIRSLSEDILAMTEGLINQYQGGPAREKFSEKHQPK